MKFPQIFLAAVAGSALLSGCGSKGTSEATTDAAASPPTTTSPADTTATAEAAATGEPSTSLPAGSAAGGDTNVKGTGPGTGAAAPGSSGTAAPAAGNAPTN